MCVGQPKLAKTPIQLVIGNSNCPTTSKPVNVIDVQKLQKQDHMSPNML